MQTQVNFQAPATDIYTVSRLNNVVRNLLEGNFSTLWVEGEISNFSAPHSGHWYFGLKDSSAQVRCALFKGAQRKLQFIPRDGMHVLVKAKVSLYENRGEFQLICEDMEERGEGQLRRAFEILKAKLAAAGLFASEHKKSLPQFPKRIGVITSATGAAIKDILSILKRRQPSIPIIIYPTLVQGTTAAPAIKQAIEIANHRNECDVLIVARGGGSLEDLWPFNEEIVAQAIHQSQLPIISAVGHEVDFTISDFVADLRAPTPSAAAELIALDKIDLLQTLQYRMTQLQKCINNHCQKQTSLVSWMFKHLQQQHPQKQLHAKSQQLDFAELNFVKLLTHTINQSTAKLNQAEMRLHKITPAQHIRLLNHRIAQLLNQFKTLMEEKQTDRKRALANICGKLDAMSPLATLQRGYAIVTANQQVIVDSAQVNLNDKINVKLATGHLTCQVTETE